jgi:hypothetical protein
MLTTMQTENNEFSDENMVQSIDWRFGVSVNSSHINNNPNTYFQLKFVTKTAKSVQIELNLTQFNRLLEELELALSQLNNN